MAETLGMPRGNWQVYWRKKSGMKTPEGRLKEDIRKRLKQLGAYAFNPVQMGYGRQTLDILCCVPAAVYTQLTPNPVSVRVGRFVGIEVKAPGKKPTPRQEQCIQEIKAAGGVAFYCDTLHSFLMCMEIWGLNPPPKSER